MTEKNNMIEENAGNIPSRRNDIDALRVYALILLIIFHTAMLFSLYTWYFIQNDELSFTIFIFIMFVDIFHMPLLFLIAGMSTFYSLNKRSGKEYSKERLKRLVIPLILGIFLIIPVIVYFERLAWWCDTRYHPINFNGTIFEFYGHYLMTGIDWYHLWFIAYLSLFSLIALPLFLRSKKERGKQQISSIANYFGEGKKIFLLALPLIIINISLRWFFPGLNKYIIDDWAHVLFYLTIFIYGFLIVGDIRFENSVDRNKKLALNLAINLSITVIILIILGTMSSNSSGNSNPIEDFIWYTIFWTLWSLSSWCWLIAIFGYGKKHLNKQNSTIKYLSEIALPMYILHLMVIIMIGFFIIQWEIHWLAKFIIITVSSLFLTILLCEVVKTNNITRFMLGMRPKVKKREVE